MHFRPLCSRFSSAEAHPQLFCFLLLSGENEVFHSSPLLLHKAQDFVVNFWKNVKAFFVVGPALTVYDSSKIFFEKVSWKRPKKCKVIYTLQTTRGSCRNISLSFNKIEVFRIAAFKLLDWENNHFIQMIISAFIELFCFYNMSFNFSLSLSLLARALVLFLQKTYFDRAKIVYHFRLPKDVWMEKCFTGQFDLIVIQVPGTSYSRTSNSPRHGSLRIKLLEPSVIHGRRNL